SGSTTSTPARCGACGSAAATNACRPRPGCGPPSNELRAASMTYCVAIALDEGMLFASDSRTNAGVDHVSTFSKMSVFETPGERAIVLLNSGNLATTQAVVSTLRQALHSERPNL